MRAAEPTRPAAEARVAGPSQGRLLASGATWCAAAAALIAATVVLGWGLDSPRLRSVLPGAVEMKFNTAAGLLGAAASLWLARPGTGRQRTRVLAQVLALLVGLLGALTLAQYVFGWKLGIDELVVADRAGQFNAIKGRMSPYTAVGLVSIGSALVLLLRRRAPLLSGAGAVVALVIGAVSAIGYSWNAVEITTDAVLPPVAINTALALILLGSGVLAAGRARQERRSGRREPRWAISSIEIKILLGFIGSFLLLLVGGGLSYQAGEAYADAAAWVTHTQKVRAALSQFQADLSNAALAQRTYLITRQNHHLVVHRDLMAGLEGKRQRLHALVRDNPRQVQQVEELGPLIHRMEVILGGAVDAAASKGFAAVQTLVAQNGGVETMQQMSSAIERMELDEDRLLDERESAASASRSYMLISLLSTLAIAAGVLALLFRSIRAQIHARRLAEGDLVLAVESAQLARREADEANRAKSSFLAAMSHEIRTPMNGVLGLLELLSLGRLDPEQHATLDVVRQSGRSLLRIVDDILDFSRIEAGKLQLNPHPASMERLVQRVCQMYSGVASSKGLLLHGTVDAAVARAHVCDELRLEQILNNFVSNAIKFTEHGTVSVEVSCSSGGAPEQELTFRVTDTGIGIARDKMDRLFQPFSQAEAGTSSRFGGTGLGLTICRRIAGLMGGNADIRSEEGVGTVASLVVKLPIADEQSLGMDPTQLEQVPLEHCRAVPDVDVAAEEGTLLLVVDDHPTNRMLLKRQLNMLGYAVETAPDGKSALEAFHTGRFGAVMTDCNMPEMSGYELARRIRESEARSGRGRIPILACTANAMASEAAICADAGMDDCVVKPVQLMELRRRLEKWLPLPTAAEGKDGGSLAVDEIEDDVPFDVARLAEVAGDGASEQDQVLREFYRFNDIDVAELRRAVLLDTADLDRITHLAHRIHGASRMVGAFGLGSASHAVEVASRSGDVAGVRSSFSALESELIRLDAYRDRRFRAELQRD